MLFSFCVQYYSGRNAHEQLGVWENTGLLSAGNRANNMDKKEATQILSSELEAHRSKPYSELVELIGGEPIVSEPEGHDGVSYCIEILVFWDDKPDQDVRVNGSIDDGGWRAFFPLCDGFIKNSSNEFVDE